MFEKWAIFSITNTEVGGDEDIVVSEAVFKLSSSADMAIFSHLAAEILPTGHKVIFNTDDFGFTAVEIMEIYERFLDELTYED
ncbi:MAG: hypothetical protein ACRC6X_06640 [Culicoidibacterales bacterium]